MSLSAKISLTSSPKLENQASFLPFPLTIHTQPTTSLLFDLVNTSQTPNLYPFLITLGTTVSVFCMDHALLMPDFVHFSPCPALHPHPFPDCSRQRYPKPASDRAAFLPKAFLAVFYFMLLFPIFCSIFW